ncbi:MAG: DUF2231 domain-containing protein [Desulfobacterales bacterium]
MKKEFNSDSLSNHDGKNGNPAYVGFQGEVFDVTGSMKWKNGLHMNRHHAGRDLTTAFKGAPHGPEVFERFSKVGTFIKEETAPPATGILHRLLKRYPFLKRHPHPMTVHFPIALMVFVFAFNVLFLITGHRPFQTTALHCLGMALLATPVTILTGYYTWWLNYGKKTIRAVTIKKRVSFSMFFIAVILFVWRLLDPNVIDSVKAAAVMYWSLLVLLILCVVVVGWYGATLTFPLDEE